jgi:transcriptional regulator with XRE-family HTH domain
MSSRKTSNQTRLHGAQILKRERTDKKISQSELAKKLGVSQPLVSSWESGRITMSIEDVVAIEQALDYEQGGMLFQIAFPNNNPNIEERT